MSEDFSLQEFRGAFEVFQKIKPKLQPFLAKFKEHNMQWIIGGLEELYHLLHDKDVEINYKFHSFFGLKLIFDLADPFIINLIEIYFLPKILQIASYETDKSNDKRGQDYFAHLGYPADTPDLAKMGFTWVKLASEFICAAAVVKPRKMFETDELEEPSKYVIALNKLEQTGWKKYQTPAYYKEGTPETIRKNFINNMQNLDEDAIGIFSDFYVERYRQFIEQDRPYTGKLDPKKIIENCDSFVTSTLISLCAQEFAHPSIKRKLNSLQLVNSMLKWGDIEAAHLVNCTDFIDEVAKEVGNPNLGSKNLSRGKNIFSKIDGAEELKKQFYVQFLKCIQFWALCYPKTLKKKGRDSKVKAFHDELRNKLEIQFPDDRQLKEKKATFDKASERQKKRNQALLSQLDEEDPQFVSFIGKPLTMESKNPKMEESTKKGPSQQKPKQSKKGIESQSLMSDTPAGPTPLGSDYQIWKKQIAEVSKSIENLGQNQGKLDTKLARIQSFRARYEKDLQTADLSEAQFDQIFMSAEALLEKIQKIKPHIDRYRAKSYSYEQFIEAVTGKKLASSRAHQRQSEVKQDKRNDGKHEYMQEERRDEKAASKRDVNASSELPSLGSFVSRSKESVDNLAGNIIGGGKHEEKRPEKKSAMGQIAEQFSNLTPIKKAQFGQEDSKDMSLLPGISKHSIEKDEENIEPASHGSGFGLGLGSLRGKLQQVEQTGNKIKQEAKEEVVDWLNMAKGQSTKKLAQIDAKVDQLEEEIEQGVGAHVPKSLKNIAGGYKLQAQGQLSRLKDKVDNELEAVQSRFERRQSNGEALSPTKKSNKLVVSLAQSRKSSRSKVNFEESMASHISRNLDDDDDIIMAPERNPLEQSFHEIEAESRHPEKAKQLSFKQCFEQDKYLFGNDRFSKKFKLATDTFNLIKRSDSSGRKSRNKDSTISIPSILNERNKKYQEQMRYIEQKKNRQISELQKKVKVLETTGQVMKDRIVQQERQIKSIRANSEVDGSVKKASIMEDQQIVYKRFSVQNKSVKERSFYGDYRPDNKFLDPMGRLIHSRRFSNYFEQFRSEKQKRLMIKNKELLLKNDNIEFGCMTRKQKQSLVITFFITPAVDLNGLVSRINMKDENLEVQVEPKNIPSIRKGKQEKIIVTVHLISAPYYLPEIEFSYNLQSSLETQKFLIPCAFHKFVALSPVSEEELSRQFERKDMLKRGQQVPYSRKLLKNLSMLPDYFPGGTLLRRGQPNDKGQIQFAGHAEWRRTDFWIRLMIRPSQFLYIQLLSREQSDISEFYASLVTNLLMKNIDLQQM